MAVPLLLPRVELIELLLELLELLAGFGEFTMRGQAMLIVDIPCGTLDERVQVRPRTGLA